MNKRPPVCLAFDRHSATAAQIMPNAPAIHAAVLPVVIMQHKPSTAPQDAHIINCRSSSAGVGAVGGRDGDRFSVQRVLHAPSPKDRPKKPMSIA